MTLQSGRSVVRLPQLTFQYFGNRRTALSSSRVERVPALYNVSQSQNYSGLVFKYRLSTPAFHRTYAQRAVSRPKGHTGRTTTAARKAPTTSKTKAAKTPAPKKTTPKAVPKAKSKAKPRIKPKPKPAKKRKAKAKAKPKRKVKKPKKVLTEAQKSAQTKTQLKKTALKAPHALPFSAWTVFLAEKIRAAETMRVASADARKGVFGDLVKEASADYKQFTPEQVEHYNHIANQNKAVNAKAYRQWIESHTPTVIYEANLARLRLKKLGQSFSQLHDHRQVKGPRSSYLLFYQQRTQSGDLKGLKVSEASKLVGREWRGLSASDKKPFQELAAQDMTRYTQERKTVLDKDVKPHRKAQS